jgi:hypothetical protein
MNCSVGYPLFSQKKKQQGFIINHQNLLNLRQLTKIPTFHIF